MLGKAGGAKRVRSTLAAPVIGAAGMLLALFAASTMASEIEAPPPAWGTICGPLEAADSYEQKTQAARRCSLALEKLFGPDDPRLVEFYSEIAERLASGGAKAASAALPYRRRAHRAALRLFGPKTPEAGAAALNFARAKILAGRCEANSPEALSLLSAAAEGMRGGAGRQRLVGMRDVARGFADSLAYRQAESLLLEAGGKNGDALKVADWERIGLWRHRQGEAAAAAEAFRRALRLDPPPYDRRRILQSLKQALFEAGDFDALNALKP